MKAIPPVHDPLPNLAFQSLSHQKRSIADSAHHAPDHFFLHSFTKPEVDSLVRGVTKTSSTDLSLPGGTRSSETEILNLGHAHLLSSSHFFARMRFSDAWSQNRSQSQEIAARRASRGEFSRQSSDFSKVRRCCAQKQPPLPLEVIT